MKNNASLVYGLILVVGDFLALVAAFSVAYILRVKFDERPLLQQIPAETYTYAFLTVLPLWILVLALIGLYKRDVYENRFSEFGKLIVGSFLGILVVIGYDFVIDDTLFPARLVAVYGLALGFGLLLLFRTFARIMRSALFSSGFGVTNVLIIGSPESSEGLIKELENTRHSGHKILAVVSDQPSEFKTYKTLASAVEHLKNTNLHSIIQTELYKDGERNNEVANYAQRNHISYRFIPGNDELFVGNIEVELFRGTPLITVHQTALIGWGRILKRIFDLIFGTIFLIVVSPILLLVSIVAKISSPKESVFFTQTRLTQFDKPFKVYKFRSHYKRFDGMTPEKAFAALGKPELSEQYRSQGDFLEDDPRITKFGNFLRRTSIDELLQLFNVVKGDISLVGPRALVPDELRKYHHAKHILSVKSGMTGLAQISGRKDIDFEDRRKLDSFYVQNWSFWLDLIILIKTLRVVLGGKGAK